MGIWHSLEPNEPVGVVALSGPVDPARLDEGLRVLRSWGNPVFPASNLRDRDDYLAGSDDERLGGLVELLDRGVRTFIAARGGFGSTRLSDRLPWDRLIADEVRFVGFSDLTAILNPLARSVVQIHGPMAAAGLGRVGNAARLRDVLDGRLEGKMLFQVPEDCVLRHGTAEGIALGGNLSLLSALMGTSREPDFGDSVLFVEEVSEPPYRLDRLLTHLRGSASFGGVKALIGGSLHACRPRPKCLSRWCELLLEAVPDTVPVIVGMPFGHGAKNLAFPVGASVQIETRRGAITWSV